MPIYLSCQAQVVLLTSEEIGIFAKYCNFFNVFSLNFAVELLENIGTNDYPIDLLGNKQPSCNPIYNLGLVELEILKTYIKANLVSSFIKSFTSFTSISILFV